MGSEMCIRDRLPVSAVFDLSESAHSAIGFCDNIREYRCDCGYAYFSRDTTGQ